MTTSGSEVYLSTTLSEDAEISLLKEVLQVRQYNNDVWLQRRLCSYSLVSENEKPRIVLDIMEHLWKLTSANNLFKVFRDFDSVFQILDKKGHFIHSFEVFLLGSSLINLLIKRNGERIFKSNFGSYKKLLDAWLMASTAHDFGYPLEVISQLSEKFSELYEQIHLDGLSNKAKELSDAGNVDLQGSLLTVKAYNVTKRKDELVDIEGFVVQGIKYSIRGTLDDAMEIKKVLRNDKKQEPNHGYISALILAREFINYLSERKKWGKSKDTLAVKNLKMVVAAISLHSLPSSQKDLIKRISFNLNPLAFILILIDNLQEWNRSLRPSKKWPVYSLSGYKSNNREIHLEYFLEHKEWTESIEKNAKDNIKKIFKKLKCLREPSPKINFNICISFSSDHGKDFGRKTLKL